MLAGVGSPPARLAVTATNGRCLVARASGFPMQFLPIAGIADCTVCRQRNTLDHSDADGRRISHEALRAVVVEANNTAPLRPGWTLVPPRVGLLVGPDRVPVLESPS
jgi:hypothetical protein